MFKYYNSVTNRSGDALPGYFVRLFDSGGNSVDIFADDSGTPIISESGVANAAEADENGMVRFYVPSGSYDVRYFDTNDEFVGSETAIPMNAGVNDVELAGAGGAALVGTTDGDVQADLDARPTSATLAASGGAALVGFIQSGTGAVSRTTQAKARDFVNVKDFGAVCDGTTDDVAAFQAAVDSGAKFIRLPGGPILLSSTIIIDSDGVTIEGDSDYETVIWANGSGPLFQIGDTANNITQHVTLRNFSCGGKTSFSGSSYIKVRRCFQVYLERLRYKDSQKAPTEAVIVLDNNDGTSEQPVRTTIRDCYFDGADYAVSPGGPVPIAIWNTGGIQTIVDNTHIQDCEIGCKLGVNPAVDTQYYNAAFPNDDDFYDFYFTNNSRYQVGDRGGTTTSARAFDIWKGSGVNVSNSQFYLNNNGPDPALAGQRVARFNSPDFGTFTMDQCVVNCNARADNVFTFAAAAEVQRIAISATEFGGLVGSEGMFDLGAGAVVRAVIDPSCVFDNTNNFGPVDQRSNTAISPYDLGTACNHYYYTNDAGSRTFSAFGNGTIGVPYVVEFEIVSGSVTLTAAAPTATSGIIVDGFPAGNIALRNRDVLLVTRAPLAAAEYYRAKLIRGGAPFVSLTDYADDAAASAGGIAVGQQYRTGSAVKVRVA